MQDPHTTSRAWMADLAFSLAFIAIAGGVGWAFWPQ